MEETKGMDYIFKILKDSFKDLEDEKDREFLRDLSINLVPELYTDFLKKLFDMEQGVSSLYKSRDISIYTVPVNIKNLEEHSRSIYPMILEDIKSKKATDKKNVFYKKIFADLEYQELEKISKKTFIATLKSGDNIFEVKLYLKQDTRYLEKEKELLSIFELNDLDWKVLYTPYSRRFFDLYIEEIPENITLENSEINVNYSEYKDDIFEDYFLAWNIEEKIVLVDKARADLYNEKLYEYKIFSNENNSLVKINHGKIYKIKREKDGIYVYTNIFDEKDWELWNMKEINSEKMSDFKFKPLGNRKKENTISKLTENSKMRLKSEAEIHLLSNSYYDFENMILEEITVSEYAENIENTYDMNQVFFEKKSLVRKTQNLNLYFRVKTQTKYVLDELSFILSCVEHEFPEYTARGIINWK